MISRTLLLVGLLAACGGKDTPPPAAPRSEAPPAAAPAEVTIDNDELRVPGTIAFNMQSGDITPESMPALEALASYLTKREDITIVIAELRGHPVGGMAIDGNAAVATNLCSE
jgi:hypothetical protein